MTERAGRSLESEMRVKDLIKMLQSLDPDLDVEVPGSNHWTTDLKIILEEDTNNIKIIGE